MRKALSEPQRSLWVGQSVSRHSIEQYVAALQPEHVFVPGRVHIVYCEEFEVDIAGWLHRLNAGLFSKILPNVSQAVSVAVEIITDDIARFESGHLESFFKTKRPEARSGVLIAVKQVCSCYGAQVRRVIHG